ncbi:MAG: PilZ domain-containing protein, partial [Candidatus Sulfotelmatobacter sp.]
NLFRSLAENMQAVSFPSRQARMHYRHELRALTYVTLDEANGGIIRNLNHDGVAVQAVAALRPHQRVRLRFELRFPRLRVETYGQVSWATASGQCGIRFVDLPPRTSRQIDEWIFSNLLDAVARDASHPRPIFGAPLVSTAREENVRDEIVPEENAPEEDDGLTLSPSPRPAIRLEPGFARRDAIPAPHQHIEEDLTDPADDPYAHLNWLSQPLSGRTLAWLVDSLIVIAGVLLFALIFLSIAHELPPWPLTLGTASAAVVFVAAAYWTVFAVFGGPSLGARLAQATSNLQEEKQSEAANRFR